MAEAKLRLLAAENLLSSDIPKNTLASIDSELCYLQIRKIIELITFSAILREEDRYSNLRKQNKKINQRDHGDHTKDWKAPEILKRLITLSPHILPIPFLQEKDSKESITHFDRKKISINHGRLIEIYKKSSGYLHISNPFTQDFLGYISEERQKFESAPTDIRRTLKFLRDLLWNHIAVQLEWEDDEDPKEIGDPKSAWIIDFGTPDNEYVSIDIGVAETTPNDKR